MHYTTAYSTAAGAMLYRNRIAVSTAVMTATKLTITTITLQALLLLVAQMHSSTAFSACTYMTLPLCYILHSCLPHHTCTNRE
jgi:hypothetical protein